MAMPWTGNGGACGSAWGGAADAVAGWVCAAFATASVASRIFCSCASMRLNARCSRIRLAAWARQHVRFA